MTTLTLQIAESTQRSLEALSEQTGKSVPEIVDKAIEDYHRKLLFEGVDRDFESVTLALPPAFCLLKTLLQFSNTVSGISIVGFPVCLSIHPFAPFRAEMFSRPQRLRPSKHDLRPVPKLGISNPRNFCIS